MKSHKDSMNRFELLPRCGAQTRSGGRCKRPGNKRNGRCKFHGGASTGPRTVEGRQRCGQARLKHGYFSAAERERRREYREIMAEFRRLLAEIEKASPGVA